MERQVRKLLRSGRPSADLVHTGGIGAYAAHDLLADPAALELRLGQLLGAEVTGAGPADVRAARELRAALWALLYARAAENAERDGDVVAATKASAEAAAVHGGSGPGGGARSAARDTAAAVAVVNRAASGTPLAPALTPAGAVAPLQGAAAEALATLARDAVDLLGGPLGRRVRICAASDCTLLLVDASRPGRRRWCSMQRCGNLAKVRRHRSR